MYRLTHVDLDLRREVQREIDVDRVNKKKDSLVNNNTKHNNKDNNKKQNNKKKTITVNCEKKSKEFNINVKKSLYTNEDLEKGTFIDEKE